MGKQRYDPNCHPHKESNTSLKILHDTPKKTVKITYISSPVMVRACDASEFRSVVQQLTGKDSNTNTKGYIHSTFMHQNVMQNGSGLRASEDHGNSSGYYNDISIATSLQFDEDFFWKELARCVFPPPCVIV